MNLLLYHSSEKDSEGQLLVIGERALHIREVLKLKVGDRLRVGEIGIGLGTAEVVEILEGGVRLRPGELVLEVPRVQRDIILAMPRPQSLKKILQSIATMEVGRICIISSERVERSYFSSPLLREENLFEQLRLGLEQGMSTLVPQIEIFPSIKPRNNEKFAGWLEEHFPKSDFQRSIGHVLDSNTPSSFAPLSQKGRGQKQERKNLGMGTLFGQDNIGMPCVFAIGPEGGWSAGEVGVFLSAGFHPFSLGPRILRVETALVATLAQHELLLMMWGGGVSQQIEAAENLPK